MVDISTPHFLELLHIISGGERYAYYTEMHFDQAIINHQSHLEAFIGPPRPNVIVQLGGSNPETMAQAAKILQDQGYAEVNINVGCPSKAVQHGQFGAILMKSPDVVANVLSAMQNAAASIPITVKCRLGVDQLDSFEFLHDFVHTVNSTSRPLPHLIVHARKCLLRGLSPKQNRSIPPLMYDRVYELSEKFPELPMTINGGFDNTDKISMALDRVDGCMIGRKVMDNPLFLQNMDRDIYQIPEHEIKSTASIISEYIGKNKA
ncbi:tRNA-dihydrouridine synthase [Zychaea mexicana]|uniref:tRNA-dihydrouridine synthase n=1 Tax=Zychaea mexicana TaxID=64656 RepID=UPI0022FE174E|nr:tRNA-dihydrouridine synthase [Zychaea mexicana]KAI9499512.1 tRNA-dihydrouridine synthase [Zychaea mexicana]